MSEIEVRIRGELEDGFVKVKKIVIAPEGTYIDDAHNRTCLAPGEVIVRVERSPRGPSFDLTIIELLKAYKEYTGREMVDL